MFPIRDDNPTLRLPVTTVLLIVVTLACWVAAQGMGLSPALEASVCALGLVPAELLGYRSAGQLVELGAEVACRLDGIAWPNLVTSMFMHGSWLHIIGNLWFLWVFGNNVEDSMGRLRFLVFYLVGGLAAAAAQIAAEPSSAVPMVGASGAIGAVMGGYIVLYPKVRVHLLVVLGFYVTTVRVPAYVMLGYWFFLQLVSGVPTLAGAHTGVAFWAHAGGFAAGALLARVFANPELLAQHRAMTGAARWRDHDG